MPHTDGSILPQEYYVTSNHRVGIIWRFLPSIIDREPEGFEVLNYWNGKNRQMIPTRWLLCLYAENSIYFGKKNVISTQKQTNKTEM